MKKHIISLAILVLSSLACGLQASPQLDNTPPAVVTSYKRACMITTTSKAKFIKIGTSEIVKP